MQQPGEQKGTLHGRLCCPPSVLGIKEKTTLNVTRGVKTRPHNSKKMGKDWRSSGWSNRFRKGEETGGKLVRGGGKYSFKKCMEKIQDIKLVDQKMRRKGQSRQNQEVIEPVCRG